MFDFQNAEIPQGGTPNLQPGIHNVKIESITNGLSQNTQAPFLEFTVVDSNNAKLNNRYYLNTVIGEGNQKSAWDISRNAILAIVSACLNLTGAEAKAKMPQAKSVEELALKLAALVVGKEMKLKVVGEEKLAFSGSKYVNSSFGKGVFAESIKVPTSETRLYFSADKNIKRLPVVSNSISTSGAPF